MGKVYFHVDVNSAFLSWSALKLLREGQELDLRTVPSVVGGDEEKRHGVVLAKSAKTNSGHLAFYGSIEAAKEFFDADSMEGIVKRINRPDEGGDGLSDHYIEKYQAYAGGSVLVQQRFPA